MGFVGRPLTLLFLALLAAPAIAAEISVPIRGGDDLVLEIPGTWQYDIRWPREDLPPTVTIASRERREFAILVTPIWPMGPPKPPASADEVRRLVQDAADSAKPRAVEESLPLVELSTSGKVGYYFSATDRQPEPNGYKYLTQGAVGFDELLVTFTILVNGDPKPATDQALQVLRSMHRAVKKTPA
jgi:hypothetical protein